jgi:hypothetical protein
VSRARQELTRLLSDDALAVARGDSPPVAGANPLGALRKAMPANSAPSEKG